MNSNAKKIGLGIVIAILCAIAFYFLYWIKTPAYSLNIIRESVEKHDVATFEKHVDMDTLYTKAFDDGIVAVDKIQGDGTLSNPLAVGFLQMLKPPVVAALKNETIEYVKGEKENKAQSNNKADDFAQGMKSKSGVDNSKLKDITVVSKENNEAIVALTLYNQKIDKNFDLKVKMTKLDDGTWKLKEITNLVEFLMEIDKAEKEKLAELNKNIVAELKMAVPVTAANVKLNSDGNPFFASYWLNYGIELQNNTDKNITDVYVLIDLVDNNKKVFKETRLRYNQNIFTAHSKLSLSYKDKLNQFIDKDMALIENMNDKKMEVHVVGIKYADGKEVKVLEELPDVVKK